MEYNRCCVKVGALSHRRRNNDHRLVEFVFWARHLLHASGALTVNIEDFDHPGDKLLQLLRDNQIDLNVVEGLRLVVAFRKIKDPSDRRILIELAERLAK
jgi:hypothetical protein